ncbi:MAG: leucine-rich repeat protein [Clostridia bacterium]|nr:leucine-rich repeat protein [Clostridia bacterium]
MREQVFISYRRRGGDVTAKLICESLKLKGYTVFYDFDSIHGGYFDQRIFEAIEACDDVVLVLPAGSLDRCRDEDDWVRGEIRHALQHEKNIIPVMLDGFSFPADLPDDIKEVKRYNGVPFSMMYFDAMMSTIADRLKANSQPSEPETNESQGLYFSLNEAGNGYVLEGTGTCTDRDIVIPKTHEGLPVTAVGKLAFSWREYITSVTIPFGVASIGEQAFSGCKSLTTVVLPKGITQIETKTFFDCPSLTNITIPDGVKCIGDKAFYGCRTMKSIIIPDSVTWIEKAAFWRCSSLENIRLPLNIPCIARGMFKDCESLKSVTIPGGVTDIDDFAFCNCSALEKADLPDSLLSIGNHTFDCCSKLAPVRLPKHIIKIGAYSFHACNALKALIIPNSVKNIGDYAFGLCTSLESILFSGTKSEWDAIEFGQNWISDINNINLTYQS